MEFTLKQNRIYLHLYAICSILLILYILTLPLYSSATSSEHTKPIASNNNSVLKQGIGSFPATIVNSSTEQLIDGFYPPYPPTIPAPGFDPQLVNRGEYLAKIGDCIACHTDVAKGTPAFAGGLPIETPFGTFYSPNITPDQETGIGNWNEYDFIRAIKKGRDPKGRNYFPVFPYIYFSKISDDDAHALYAYFKSIPAVKQKNRPLPFPFNVPGARTTLWGWNLLFFYPNDNPIVYDNTRQAVWNRGKYIVDGLGHCGMCHTPLNIFGAPKNRFYLTGTFIDNYWAPNITKYGLRTVNEEQVAKVFSTGALLNNAGPVMGPMAEVNHNSLRYLTPDDNLAIATYLKTVVSEEPLSLIPSAAEPNLPRGKQVYLSTCVICHQSGAMGAPLIGDGDNWYYRLTTHGLSKIYANALHGFNSMPIKGACVTCSDNDVISAVNYILNASLTRSQWYDVTHSKPALTPINGKEIYQANCSTCHDTGRLGAPKIGDQAVWQLIIDKNIDVLVENVLHSASHPKYACQNKCTTGQIIEAIKYMVSQSKTEGNYSLW